MYADDIKKTLIAYGYAGLSPSNLKYVHCRLGYTKLAGESSYHGIVNILFMYQSSWGLTQDFWGKFQAPGP